MITFTAGRINDTYIHHHFQGKMYPCKVSFVKLDTNNNSDMNTLKELSKKWDKISNLNFSECIYQEATEAHLLKDKGFYNYEFYALTRQQNCFENLISDYVVGLLEVENLSKKEIEIAYIQTIPKNTYANKNREFSSIGRALIKSLKNFYSQKNIVVNSIYSAKNFYKKLGFLPVSNIELVLKSGMKIK